MHHERLINDTAMAIAQAMLDLVGPCIREETHSDAFAEFFTVAKAGLEAFCIQQDRMRQRLSPTKN